MNKLKFKKFYSKREVSAYPATISEWNCLRKKLSDLGKFYSNGVMSMDLNGSEQGYIVVDDIGGEHEYWWWLLKEEFEDLYREEG